MVSYKKLQSFIIWKKYFMFSSCDRIEGFLLDHVMYIMLYGIPCKTLHRKRENCVCTQYRMYLIKGWMLYFVCDPLLCMLSQVCVNEQGYQSLNLVLQNPNLEKRCGWRLHTDLVFLARIVFHACVYIFACDELFFFSYNSLSMRNISIVSRSIMKQILSLFFLYFELMNVVGDYVQFLLLTLSNIMHMLNVY